MAASSLNAVRVRLYFDYPPPSMPDCRMSWVLVDLNKCRVVADLCSVIREKFDYSRKTVLDLFIENCFLPPAESIYVVRDNDSIRVKVSSVACEHGRKKRCREEEGLFQAAMKKKRHEPSEVNGVTQPTGATKKQKKHKAKKKKREEQEVESGDAFKAAVPAKEPSSSKSKPDKSSKKASTSSVLTNGKVISSSMHNKSSESSDSSEEVTKKPSPSKPAQIVASKQSSVRKTSSSDSSSSDDDEKVPVKKSLKTCTSTKTPKEQTSSVTPKSTTNSTTVKKTQTPSSSDLSSSEEDDSRKGSISGKMSPVLQKSVTSSETASLLQTRPPSSSRQGEAGKTSTSKKPSRNSKMSKTQTSSDSSSSSEDEACKADGPATPKPVQTAQAQMQPCSDSCAVVENDATQTPSTPVGSMLQENKDKMESSDSSSSSDTELMIKRPNPQIMAGLTPRGRGRGFPDRVKGRGGVRGGFGKARGTPWKQNFHYNYDNEEERKEKEIQTNKSLVLQNPPEPSPKHDYNTLPLLAAPPAVGQKIVFKEGKIIGFNHSTNMVELELLTQSQARTEPGKFDLVYQNPDGSERVEYAVTLGSQLTERWESLLEPRLIVQNTG